MVDNGITQAQVKHLKNLQSDRIELLFGGGISRTILASASKRANAASPGLYPNPIIDHQTAENPYEDRFDASYYSKLASCANLSPFVSIQKLVLHIMSETKRLMKRTIHEHYCFYHDALSLIISKGTTDWLEQTVIDGVSIKDRWLVPQNGVNKGTTYAGRPACNSPEFILLDNSLNVDIKWSYDKKLRGNLPLQKYRQT